MKHSINHLEYLKYLYKRNREYFSIAKDEVL